MSQPLPHASAAEAERAIAHVKAVLNAAENSNQHGENMIVLMDRATALYQRVHELEGVLSYVLTAHGEQLTDAFELAHKALAKRAAQPAADERPPTTGELAASLDALNAAVNAAGVAPHKPPNPTINHRPAR